MRNTLKIMLFVALATFTFTSCNKENTSAVQQYTVLDITMDYANFSGNDTKATKKNWTNGDIVYLYFRFDDYEFQMVDWRSVKVEYVNGKWVVKDGESVLKSLNGTHQVQALHYTGIADPVFNNEDGSYNFPNDNEACFAIKAEGNSECLEGKIKAFLKFYTLDDFQINIKGIDFKEGKYALNIYRGDKKVLAPSFGHFKLIPYASHVFEQEAGVKVLDGPKDYIPAQKGFDKDDKEISFFVSFDRYTLPDDCITFDSATSVYTYTFNPTFELVITIDGTKYYAQRTIENKSYTQHKAYYLEGPTASDAEIISVENNADLGKGWKKVIK